MRHISACFRFVRRKDAVRRVVAKGLPRASAGLCGGLFRIVSDIPSKSVACYQRTPSPIAVNQSDWFPPRRKEGRTMEEGGSHWSPAWGTVPRDDTVRRQCDAVAEYIRANGSHRRICMRLRCLLPTLRSIRMKSNHKCKFTWPRFISGTRKGIKSDFTFETACVLNKTNERVHLCGSLNLAQRPVSAQLFWRGSLISIWS